MESNFTLAYSRDVGGQHWDSGHETLYGPVGRFGKRATECDVISIRDRRDVRWTGEVVPEEPILSMPTDLWCLIIPYLLTSEAMSLRGAARVVQKHLRVVTDSILDGYRMIEGWAQDRPVQARAAPEVIGKLLTLRLEARCDAIRRYARRAGMACSSESGHIALSKAEPLQTLTNRYYKLRSADAASPDAQAALAWRLTIDTTKSALLNATFDASQSIGLSDLYAAEMYAPLLGLIPAPYDHSRRIVRDAEATLSRLRWMDFLFAVDPLKDVCSAIGAANYTLLADFDRHYPRPRIDVLGKMVHTAFSFPLLRSVRDKCLNQFGIGAHCLAEEIIPRVTAAIAESVFTDPFMRATEIPTHLGLLAERWGSDNGAFAASLHQSFLSLLAKKSGSRSAVREGQTETYRTAIKNCVLGIATSDIDLGGLGGHTLFDFWGLYFEMTDPVAVVVFPTTAQRIERLPWPIKACLWRLASEMEADHQRAMHGQFNGSFQGMSAKSVEALCIQALADGKPQYAIPALQASIKWIVARETRAMWSARMRPQSSFAENVDHAARWPVISEAEWSIFAACSLAERLPFVATLFACRNAVKRCGYEWTYDAMIAEDVVDFLCHPGSSLTRPSTEVVAVLLHHLPLCGQRLPEFSLGPNAGKSACSKRFDLPFSDNLDLPIGA